MRTLLAVVSCAVLALTGQACSTPGGGPAASVATAGAGGSAQGGGLGGEGLPDLQGGYVPAKVGAPPDPGPEQTFRIGPYDLLKIEVFQVAALSSEVRVDDKGFVMMPLIGAVQVGGLTPQEAEQAIAHKLGEQYLQNPQVRIFVSEYASQKVTVIGIVKKPGVFPVAGKTTLMQAIALAGGLDDVARKNEIVIFRKQPGGNVNAYVVDLAAIEEGRQPDPVIVADDRIVVSKSGAAVLSKAIGNVLTGWAMRAPF